MRTFFFAVLALGFVGCETRRHGSETAPVVRKLDRIQNAAITIQEGGHEVKTLAVRSGQNVDTIGSQSEAIDIRRRVIDHKAQVLLRDYRRRQP